MKKDVFADWLREFCMLVFIQTIQAFIFAIVMSLIISVFTGEFADEDNAAGSTGIICVVILASVSKVEEIVKKVFGIKSGFHDSGMRGGLKSLATTMMAGKIAKGALDNVGKIAGGAVGIVGANKGIARQRARMARDINQYGPKPASQSGISEPNSVDYLDKAKELKLKGDMRGYERNRGIAAGINKANAAAISSNKNAGDPIKLQEKIDSYDDKIRELKQKRRSSMVSFASGINETVGAVGGGIIGMTAGAAMGEGKEIIQGGLTGVGVGDTAGKIGTKIAMAPLTMGGGAKDLVSDVRDVRKANAQLQKEVSDFSSVTKDAIQTRDKQIRSTRQAKKKLNEELKNIDAGNMDM